MVSRCGAKVRFFQCTSQENRLLATEVRQVLACATFHRPFPRRVWLAGEHHRPPIELAGLYVDQFPDRDLSRERARRHRSRFYPTVEEALTLGGSNWLLMASLIIAEHGRYPRTEKGQTLYPRYEFFRRTMRVFEASGRAVPVFNDKTLSTNWNECVAMVRASKRLGFLPGRLVVASDAPHSRSGGAIEHAARRKRLVVLWRTGFV
jgi:hypothetical protein